jgi:hypothetical protein
MGKPPFHPSTLPLSLLPLFRLPPESLTKLTQIISFSPIPKSTVGHLLVHAIEDLAGVRSSKAEERRRVGGGDFVEGGGWLPRPTIGYTLDLLLLSPPPDNGDGDGEERIAILKLVLVSTMVQCTTTAPADARARASNRREGEGEGEGDWKRGQDPEWRGELISRFSGRWVGVDGMREVLIMMLDRQCSRNWGEAE